MGDDTIEGIRRRPGMYFGSTTSRGLHQLITEVVSNCMDQALVGKVSRIEVDVVGEEVTIVDDGPGIPIAPGVSGTGFLEEVLTKYHHSPTADGHAPHVHLAGGVGLAAVNAVCSVLTVDIDDGRGRFRQRFAHGSAVSPLEVMGESTGATGTAISFRPDPDIWREAVDTGRLRETMRDLAWLTPGLTTRFNSETFGPVADLSDMFGAVKGKSTRLLHARPLQFCRREGIAKVDIAIGWIAEGLGSDVRSFCNYRATQRDGVEATGIEQGLRLAFGRADARELLAGMICVLNITLVDPTFGDPTRHRLDSPEAIELIAAAVAKGLPASLEADPALRDVLRARVG